MKSPSGRRYQKKKGRLLPAILLALFLAVGGFAAFQLVSTQLEYAGAQQEYSELRGQEPAGTPNPAGQTASPGPEVNLSSINPDYIAWLNIAGTNVDYPVVQGYDNDKYMYTTFKGSRNASGAVFMDYRSTDEFDSRFAIIYGHNMKDSSMFADLNHYRTNGYLETHSRIDVVTKDGEKLTYRIFSVKHTDEGDKAYTMPDQGQSATESYLASLGAPAGADVIALSTCTNTGGDEERLLVFAAVE